MPLASTKGFPQETTSTLIIQVFEEFCPLNEHLQEQNGESK
jgi:hypothetical protein